MQLPTNLPRHIAIIMDGNGRWAKKRLLPRHWGHRAGVQTVRRVVQYCGEQSGIEVLTLFAFSSENWRRPPQEVNWLFELFATALQNEIKELHKNQIRLHIIGDRQAFSHRLVELITQAEQLTAQNTGLTLVIAANYGGQRDIVTATRELAHQVVQGHLQIDEINEELFAQHLSLADLPAPELLIRTGGEQRISNFLLWQLAYTELFFTDVLWPDFDQDTFMQALSSYGTRQRRFGRTGEQVIKKNA
jgi:undecaprenyl diphosphate synthase